MDDDDDFAPPDSRLSVAGSDYANVSEVSDEQSLAVKDTVNWREYADIWAAVVQVDLNDLSPQHQLTSDVYAVVRYAYDIPRSRLRSSDVLSLDQLAYTFPQLLSNDAGQIWDDYTDGNELLAIAHDLQQMALAMVQRGASDEGWDTFVHDRLITQCGMLLLTESLLNTFPASDFELDNILNTRKIRPRGVVPAPSDSPTSFYVASISTRSQVASFHERPESIALHQFSLMATDAILASGIQGPIFGIMCDRQLVRMHVDWIALERHISAPVTDSLAGTTSLPPFKELDLTRADDAVRVVFILDAVRVYARRMGRLLAVSGKMKGTVKNNDEGLSSVEKVSEWMKKGGG